MPGHIVAELLFLPPVAGQGQAAADAIKPRASLMDGMGWSHDPTEEEKDHDARLMAGPHDLFSSLHQHQERPSQPIKQRHEEGGRVRLDRSCSPDDVVPPR